MWHHFQIAMWFNFLVRCNFYYKMHKAKQPSLVVLIDCFYYASIVFCNASMKSRFCFSSTLTMCARKSKCVWRIFVNQGNRFQSIQECTSLTLYITLYSLEKRVSTINCSKIHRVITEGIGHRKHFLYYRPLLSLLRLSARKFKNNDVIHNCGGLFPR